MIVGFKILPIILNTIYINSNTCIYMTQKEVTGGVIVWNFAWLGGSYFWNVFEWGGHGFECMIS